MWACGPVKPPVRWHDPDEAVAWQGLHRPAHQAASKREPRATSARSGAGTTGCRCDRASLPASRSSSSSGSQGRPVTGSR
ncbi:MAG: hypothetical protein ACK559_07160 [bacterium]